MLGFSDELRREIDFEKLGAFITNPISLHPRTPAKSARLLTYEGGVLLHTGLPNPGLHEVIRRHQSHWLRMPCPVILHLLATNQDEMITMVDRLDGVDTIQGIEVGLLDVDPAGEIRILEAACTSLLPVIARLPLDTHIEHILAFERVGVAAISLGPPRGTIAYEDQLISGRLYGPTLLPQLMHTITQIASAISCPIIASAGIYAREDAEQLLMNGADAIALNTVLWTDPDALLEPPLTFSGTNID
jgi:dihydroorotate dehydrogenase (NAD+) catalytic subunit